MGEGKDGPKPGFVVRGGKPPLTIISASRAGNRLCVQAAPFDEPVACKQYDRSHHGEHEAH